MTTDYKSKTTLGDIVTFYLSFINLQYTGYYAIKLVILMAIKLNTHENYYKLKMN